MDKIEKLLNKISRQDRERLLEIVQKLIAGNNNGLHISKVKGTDFYRVKTGRFRIIYHRDDETGEAVIDHIRLRNERTYEGL